MVIDSREETGRFEYLSHVDVKSVCAAPHLPQSWRPPACRREKRQERWAPAAQLAASYDTKVNIVRQTYLSVLHLSCSKLTSPHRKTLFKTARTRVHGTPGTGNINTGSRPTKHPDNNRHYYRFTMSDNTFFVLQVRTSNIRMLKYFLVWFATAVVIAFVVGFFAGVMLQAAGQRQQCEQCGEVVATDDGGWAFVNR